ncbi:Sulfotransferase family protein [Balamuthia mandrillaris]
MRVLHFVVPFGLGIWFCLIMTSLWGQNCSPNATPEQANCEVQHYSPLAYSSGICLRTNDNNKYKDESQSPVQTAACLSCAERLTIGKELGYYFDDLRGYPSKPSSRAVNVFGLGLSKTGTTSLTAALKELGIRCWHTPMETTEDLLFMTTADKVSPLSVDIVRRWDSSRAVTDTPVPYYFEELLLMYPNAKFILTVRDAAAWWRSWKAHMERHPQPIQFSNVTRVLHYGSRWPNEYSSIKAFLRHNRLVQTIIPPEQLLVMDVAKGDGYNKLCAFLSIAEHKCPPDSEFPVTHTRAQAEVRRQSVAAQVSEQSRKRRAGDPWFLKRR